jgi:hypothetical protein
MSAVVGGIVSFDYAGWSLRYPELAAYVSPPLGQLYFNEATIYLNNTPCSPVSDSSVGGMRYMLLNMLTAHIAALNAPLGGQPSSPLVGRVSNATEGSVTVATENKFPEGTVQWYQQTKYGAAFWAASAMYRTAIYTAPCPRNFEPALFTGYFGPGQ